MAKALTSYVGDLLYMLLYFGVLQSKKHNVKIKKVVF